MSHKYRLAVIVPFHNSERTLERTLMSLLEQSARDVHYILVNDGSSDHSLMVVEEFVKLHPEFADRHTLLSYEFMRGSSEAINIGLRHVDAEFVIKCDSDDTVDKDYYNQLLEYADKQQADIVYTPITLHQGNKTSLLTPRRHITSLNDMPLDTVHFSLCNKIIRYNLLTGNGIEAYPHIDCWEDLGIVSRVMANRPKTAYLNIPGYHYYLIPGNKSLSRSHNNVLLRDHLMCALLLEQWFLGHDPTNAYQEFMHHLKFLSKIKMLKGDDKNVQRWKATFPEANCGIMHLRHIKWYHRILLAIIAKLPTGLGQWAVDKL